MFFSKPKKTIKMLPKLCPLINNPCAREGCMMFRKTVTGAGYCGLAARDQGECFKLEYEDGGD